LTTHLTTQNNGIFLIAAVKTPNFTERKKPHEKRRCRLEDNIKVDLGKRFGG
jgi:hypothetical protein